MTLTYISRSHGMCEESICGNDCETACSNPGGSSCTLRDMIYEQWFRSKTRAGEKRICLTTDNGGQECSQVVWQDSEYIGCYYHRCPGANHIEQTLLCNYGPPADFSTKPNAPYGPAVGKLHVIGYYTH